MDVFFKPIYSTEEKTEKGICQKTEVKFEYNGNQCYIPAVYLFKENGMKKIIVILLMVMLLTSQFGCAKTKTPLKEKPSSPSLAGLKIGDSRDKIIEILGNNYQSIEYDIAGHYPEAFMIWEYEEGVTVILGKDSGSVFELRSRSPKFETNLGAKVGDTADSVLSMYRSQYEEPESIHGGQLKGVFKVEDGAALIFDFDMKDGIANQGPIDKTDQVERIILTMPSYIDESF